MPIVSHTLLNLTLTNSVTGKAQRKKELKKARHHLSAHVARSPFVVSRIRPNGQRIETLR